MNSLPPTDTAPERALHGHDTAQRAEGGEATKEPLKNLRERKERLESLANRTSRLLLVHAQPITSNRPASYLIKCL